MVWWGPHEKLAGESEAVTLSRPWSYAHEADMCLPGEAAVRQAGGGRCCAGSLEAWVSSRFRC